MPKPATKAPKTTRTTAPEATKKSGNQVGTSKVKTRTKGEVDKAITQPKQYMELMDKVLKFIESGKTYNTREIVLGLGREPGAREGNPVLNALTKLMDEGKVKGERKPNGWVWSKVPRTKVAPRVTKPGKKTPVTSDETNESTSVT